MTTWRETLWGKDDAGLNLIKQLPAGLIENTVANTSTTGGYSPSILQVPGQLSALVGALINKRKDGKPFSGDNALERYANDSIQKGVIASNRTNNALGTHNPQNADELAMRLIPGLVSPIKGASIARGLETVPVAARILKGAREGATVAGKYVPKVAKIAAKAVGEAVTPFPTTNPKIAIPIGAAMTAGLDVINDQQVDPSTGAKYDGTVREALKMGHESPLVDTGTPDHVDPEFADVAATLHQSMVDTGQVDEFAGVHDALATPPTPLEEAAHHEEHKLSRFQDAALAVGALVTGGAMLKYSSGWLKARNAAAVAEDLPQFTGKSYRHSEASLYTRAKTAVLQQDEPIRDMAAQHLSKAYAKQWGYKADRMTTTSIDARIQHFFQTGLTPVADARSVKLAPLAQAFAKELAPKEQRLVSDALNAASALDDYKATGVLSSLTKDKEGKDVTPAQLEMLVQTVTSNPKTAKYFSAIQKSYDDLGKYRVIRGRDTPENYAAMRERRPNYVAMNRNLETDSSFTSTTHRYSANDDQGLGAARSTEAGGGVSGPLGVGNPFLSLFDEWAGEIRRSDLNDVRKDFLVDMDASGAMNKKGFKIIEKVDPIRSNEDDVHVVHIDGKQQAFKVRDPMVNTALHMGTRAVVKPLEALRQFQQSMTTGPLATVFNLFAAAKSPIYDAAIANIARPKGVKIGLANRAMLGGYTGAVRYMWDDMRGAMGTTLRDNMIRDHSWLKSMIGEQNLDTLATVFENSYENSIKSQLDKYGISNKTMHGSPDASKLASGVEQVAPDFASASEQWIRDDIARAASEGDVTPFQAALGQSRSLYATAKGSTLARVYGSLMEGLHNGVRYSAYAANNGRGQSKNIDKLVSDMRRLSADSSQHGGNDAVNMGLGSLMYANLGVQSLYQVGKVAAENPAHFAMNMAVFTGTLAAMHYAALASDPAAMEKHTGKTPQQKAASLTTWGGAEMPLDPITRLWIASTFPLYDQISGINSPGGKDYNPNFFHVMDSWLSDSGPQQTEQSKKEASVGLWEAIKSNNPLAPGSFPAGNIVAAQMGVDPGMSRMTDQTMLEHTQQLTGMEDDTTRPNSLLSGHMENLITTIGSTAGRSIYQMVDDMYRAFDKKKADGSRVGLNEALDVGLSRWRDTASKGAGLAEPLLFGQYPHVQSASDVNYQLMKDREAGIKQAVDVLNRDAKTPNSTAYSPRNLTLPPEPGVADEKPNIAGTEAEWIGGMTSLLQTGLAPHEGIIKNQSGQVENINSYYLMPMKQRNTEINKINADRRYQRMYMLNLTQEYEKLISERIGRPFSYKDYDPKDHLIPMPQSQAQSPAPSVP